MRESVGRERQRERDGRQPAGKEGREEGRKAEGPVSSEYNCHHD